MAHRGGNGSCNYHSLIYGLLWWQSRAWDGGERAHPALAFALQMTPALHCILQPDAKGKDAGQYSNAPVFRSRCFYLKIIHNVERMFMSAKIEEV